jgi:hypothetical protein
MSFHDDSGAGGGRVLVFSAGMDQLPAKLAASQLSFSQSAGFASIFFGCFMAGIEAALIDAGKHLSPIS